MCMGMQQWMSALLDDGFRRCKEAEGQTRLTDETRSGRPAGDCFLPGLNTCPCQKVEQNGGTGRRLYSKVTK